MVTQCGYFMKPRLMPMWTKNAITARAIATLIVPMFILCLLPPMVQCVAPHGGKKSQGYCEPPLWGYDRSDEQPGSNGHKKSFPIFHVLTVPAGVLKFKAPVRRSTRRLSAPWASAPVPVLTERELHNVYSLSM